MNYKFIVSTLIVTLFASSASARVNTSETTLIQGFSKWQAGRVERIMIDEALRDISENSYVNRFFPETSENIVFNDGNSAKGILKVMQFYIRKDIEQFKNTVDTCIPYNVSQWFNQDIEISERLKYAKQLHDGLLKLASKPKDNNYTVKSFVSESCKKHGVKSCFLPFRL